MHSVDSLDDRSGDSQRAVAAPPTHAAALGLEDQDAGLVFEEASNRVRAQAPSLRDLRDAEVLF